MSAPLLQTKDLQLAFGAASKLPLGALQSVEIETLATLDRQRRAISEAMKPQVVERTLAQRPSS